jgi:6-phosphogluconolactonase
MTRPFMPEGDVLPDARSLAEGAAEVFIHLADQAFQFNPQAQEEIQGRFTVVLVGGSTPRQLYTRLAVAKVNWENIHFFWGDERCVPPSHVESNYRMANEALLSHIPILGGNIHRIQGEFPAEEAAQKYEEELRRFFGGATPRFNLVLLGLGMDGHTASLFPGAPATREKKYWVAAVHHRVPPLPLVDRVTLTFPVLNAAANVLFLVSGAEKAETLAQVLHGPSQPDQLPAQEVRPINGTVRWFVDQAAAGKRSSQ